MPGSRSVRQGGHLVHTPQAGAGDRGAGEHGCAAHRRRQGERGYSQPRPAPRPGRPESRGHAQCSAGKGFPGRHPAGPGPEAPTASGAVAGGASHPKCVHIHIPARPHPSCVACTPCLAPRGLSFPSRQGRHGCLVNLKNERFMGRGSSPKTTCLSSFLGSPAQWASPVYLHAALSGGAASPFDEKDCSPERLRDWLKATQRSSLY